MSLNKAVAAAPLSIPHGQGVGITDAILEAALLDLHHTLEKAAKSSSHASVTSNKKLRAILRDGVAQRRKRSARIDSSFIGGLTADIEEGGIRLCTCLTPELFSIVLHIILQVTYSRDSERALYLLAASLYRDKGFQKEMAHDITIQEDALKSRKADIAFQSLSVLLLFFTAKNNYDGMRQWAGILLLQLLQDCEKGVMRFELLPDALRRKLGPLVLQERNEIIRIICGSIISSLYESRVDIETLWPEKSEGQFENFPKPGLYWNRRFQAYIDQIGQNISPNTESRVGEVYFCMDLTITPSYKIGYSGHNMTITLERGLMNIWSTAIPKADAFYQSLQIPLKLFTSMTITSADLGTAYVTFRLDGSSAGVSYINCLPFNLTDISMMMVTADTGPMQEEISAFNEKMEVKREVEASQEQNDPLHGSNKFQPSIRSVTTGKSDDAIYFSDGIHRVGPRRSETQILETLETEVQNFDSKEDVTDLPKNKGNLDQDSSAQAKRGSSNAHTIAVSRTVPPATTKSKAKPPILKSQIFEKSSKELSKYRPNTTPSKETSGNPRTSVCARSPNNEPVIGILGSRFPQRSEPELRAALTATHGIVEAATTFLKRYSRCTNPEIENGNSGMFHSESISGLEPDNTSTPKLHELVENGTKKPVSTFTYADAKVKLPLHRDLTQEFQVTSQGPTTPSAAKPKRFSLNTNTSRILKAKDTSYEIPDVEEVDDDGTYEPSSKTKKSKTRQAPTGRTTKESNTGGLKKQTTAKVKRTSQELVTKKSGSRPTRTQRSVAGKASLITQGVLNNNTRSKAELANETATQPTFLSISQKMPKSYRPNLPLTVGADDTKHSAEIYCETPSVPDDIDQIQPGPNISDIANLKKHLAQSKIEDFDLDDIYDASPRKQAERVDSKLSQRNSDGDAYIPSKFALQKSSDTPHSWASAIDSLVDWINPAEKDTTSTSEQMFLASEISGKTAVHKKDIRLQATKRNLMKQWESTKTVKIAATAHEMPLPPPPDNDKTCSSDGLDPATEASKSRIVHQIEAIRHEDDIVNLDVDDEGGDVIVQARSAMIDQGAASAMKYNPQWLNVVEVPSKRKRTEKSPDTKVQLHLQRSPQIRERKVNIVENETKIRGSLLTRVSPRLVARASARVGAAVKTPKKTPLADDYCIRKQQIIGFDSKGATNQGFTSTERKRKLVDDGTQENHFTKRSKSVSPEHHSEAEMNIREGLRSPQQQLQSSSPHSLKAERKERLVSRKVSRFSRKSSGLTRPLSQRSVNSAGSPIGGTPVDHIGKAKQRLADDSPLQIEDPRPPLSAIFGPRISLVGLHKARPSSPAEEASGYTLCQKTDNGLYTDVDTNQVIAPATKLADPFVGKITRTPSGFTERLVATASQVLINSKQDYNTIALQKNRNNDLMQVRGTKNTGIEVEKMNLLTVPRRPKMTKKQLKESEHSLTHSNRGEDSRLGVTSDSYSVRSESIQSESQDQVYHWSTAIRPHYSHLQDAVHRIADEVLIRLADEEDIMRLVVEQYHDGGNKLIDQFSRSRNDQQQTLREEVDQKRHKIINLYTEMKGHVIEGKADHKVSSISDISKQWRKDQEAIQRTITENKQSSDF